MIDKAMILAAGLGTRMRPITDKIPKPLVEVNHKALIDYKLDAVRRAGIKTVVVNVHHLADQLENHLTRCKNLEIIISDERDLLMDSGGGIAKALANFGDEAFLVLNSDTFWIGDKTPSLLQLFEYWNDKKMDILMALADVNHAVGFDGAGDFFMDDEGYLTRRGEKNSAPYAFASDYIVHPRIFRDLPDVPEGRFSSNMLFDRAIDKRRLTGTKLEGLWLNVGTPQSVRDAEKAIALHQS